MPTCSSASPKDRPLLAFRVNQGVSASFSLLLSGPPGSGPLKDQQGKKTMILTFKKMGCMHAKSLQSCLTLCGPVDCNPSGSSGGILQGFSSMGFSRQEYWGGWPFPSPGDLPDPGTESTSLISCIGGEVLTTSATWEEKKNGGINNKSLHLSSSFLPPFLAECCYLYSMVWFEFRLRKRPDLTHPHSAPDLLSRFCSHQL